MPLKKTLLKVVKLASVYYAPSLKCPRTFIGSSVLSFDGDKGTKLELLIHIRVTHI